MDKRQYMRDFLAANCLLTGQTVKLSGGGESSFYFDCKRATLDGGFLAALAEAVLDIAAGLQPSPTVIGGPTLGADFIAAAAILRAHQRGAGLTTGCIVRKAAKAHGTENKIENAPSSPASVLVVEDVITTGGSIMTACDALLAAGNRLSAIIAMIDREAGGKQALEQKYGVPVIALFNRADFPEAAQ